MPVARFAARMVATAGQILLGLITIIIFGAGVPLLWLWVGSQLQGGTAPSMSGLGVALAGIIASYSLLAVLLAWIKELLRGGTKGPVRYAWNRSLTAERHQGGRTTHALEDVIVATTIVVGVVCTAWFLLFGHPGVPVGS
jgi:hypothetical protein